MTATHSRLCVIRQSFTPSMQSPTGTYRPQPGYSLERRPNGVPYDPESENKEGLIATSNPERGARRFSLLALRSRAEWSGIRCDRISATHGEGLIEVTAQRSTLDGPNKRRLVAAVQPGGRRISRIFCSSASGEKGLGRKAIPSLDNPSRNIASSRYPDMKSTFMCG